MVDKAKTPAEKKAWTERMKKRVTVDEMTAFNAYMMLEHRSLANLLEKLLADGHKISIGTLKRWSVRGKWNALGNNTDNVTVNRVVSMIAALKEEASKIDHDVYKGLQARLLVRLAEAIVSVKIETPRDVIEMFSAVNDARGLVHDALGVAITEGGKDGNNVTSLMPLGFFKNPSAKA